MLHRYEVIQRMLTATIVLLSIVGLALAVTVYLTVDLVHGLAFFLFFFLFALMLFTATALYNTHVKSIWRSSQVPKKFHEKVMNSVLTDSFQGIVMLSAMAVDAMVVAIGFWGFGGIRDGVYQIWGVWIHIIGLAVAVAIMMCALQVWRCQGADYSTSYLIVIC